MRPSRVLPALAGAALLALALFLVLRGGSEPEPAPPAVASPTEAEQDRGERPGEGEAPEASLVPVTRVVDGDTIWVGGEERVRLLGIDTPEVDWYGGEAECFGDEAGRFLRRMLASRRVRLELDREPTDRYGRTLAYVYLDDGRMVNLLLVRRGLAEVLIYPPNHRYEERLRSAEAEARGAGRGLWGACRG